MDTLADPTTSNATLVKKFPTINYPDADLADLRRRIKATRWPTRELVPDQSQGVQLAMIQALAGYWGTDYDWRKCEAQAQRNTAVFDRDRRPGNPFHPRALEA